MYRKAKLKNHPIFYQMNDEEIERILTCFSFQEKKYERDEYIFMEGDPVQLVGLILHGTVLMEKTDPFGNNYFFTELREHEIFAEPFMDYQVQNSSVNYKAMTNCSILFFHYRDMWRPCSHNCRCHSVFTQNLMNLLALKTRSLLIKIEVLSKKSLRDRILTFLYTFHRYKTLAESREDRLSPCKLERNQVFVPYNHTELAEYLGVNRSALVRELGRMRREEIIDFDQNIYTLFPQPPSETPPQG